MGSDDDLEASRGGDVACDGMVSRVGTRSMKQREKISTTQQRPNMSAMGQTEALQAAAVLDMLPN